MTTSTSGGWSCGSCTFDNVSAATRCAVCETNRPSTAASPVKASTFDTPGPRRAGHDGDGTTAAPAPSGVHVPAFHTTTSHPLIPPTTPAPPVASPSPYARAGKYDGPDKTLIDLRASFQAIIEDGYIGWEAFYESSFDALATGSGSDRRIPQQRARDAWKFLFTGPHAYVHLDPWIMFLETAHHGKLVTQETWTQLQRFVRDVPPDFRGYEPFGLWNGLLDEWVSFAKLNIDLTKYRKSANGSSTSASSGAFGSSFFSSSPSSFSTTSTGSTTSSTGFTFATTAWGQSSSAGSFAAWSTASAFTPDHASSTSTSSTTSATPAKAAPLFGGGPKFEWSKNFDFASHISSSSTASASSGTIGSVAAAAAGSRAVIAPPNPNSFVSSLTESKRSRAGSNRGEGRSSQYGRSDDKKRHKTDAKSLHSGGISKSSAKKSSLPGVTEDADMEEDDDDTTAPLDFSSSFSNVSFGSFGSWTSDLTGTRADCGFVGLSNQGATCYMNSLLQSLYMTPEFRRALYQYDYNEETDPAQDDCIPYQLQQLFAKLQLSNSRAVETKQLTTSFGWKSSEAFQQHDVQELLRVLFDAMEHTVNTKLYQQMVTDLYQGLFKDYVLCKNCGAESARTDRFLDLSLVIRDLHSLEEALEHFVTPDLLENENAYKCVKCDTKGTAAKGTKIVALPYMLTITLKRFDLNYETMSRVKLNHRVTFPFWLSAEPFVTAPDAPNLFPTAEQIAKKNKKPDPVVEKKANKSKSAAAKEGAAAAAAAFLSSSLSSSPWSTNTSAASTSSSTSSSTTSDSGWASALFPSANWGAFASSSTSSSTTSTDGTGATFTFPAISSASTAWSSTFSFSAPSTSTGTTGTSASSTTTNNSSATTTSSSSSSLFAVGQNGLASIRADVAAAAPATPILPLSTAPSSVSAIAAMGYDDDGDDYNGDIEGDSDGDDDDDDQATNAQAPLEDGVECYDDYAEGDDEGDYDDEPLLNRATSASSSTPSPSPPLPSPTSSDASTSTGPERVPVMGAGAVAASGKSFQTTSGRSVVLKPKSASAATPAAAAASSSSSASTSSSSSSTSTSSSSASSSSSSTSTSITSDPLNIKLFADKKSTTTTSSTPLVHANMEMPESMKGGSHVYELFSVLVHSGGAMGGHYYAFIKSFNDNKWYQFNDSTVSPATQSEIEACYGGGSGGNAYMLMYRHAREGNLQRVTDDVVPARLKSSIDKVEEKAKIDRDPTYISITGQLHQPGDAPAKPIECSLRIPRSTTVKELREALFKRFSDDGVLASGLTIERCRLRILNADKQPGEPINTLIHDTSTMTDMKWSDNRTIVVECIAANGTFVEYRPYDITVHIHAIDSTTREYQPMRPLKTDRRITVASLKIVLGALLKAPVETIFIWLLHEKVMNKKLELLPEDDEAIGMAGISHDGTAVYVESIANGDITASNVKRIYERDKNSINIKFNTPVDGVDLKATVYDHTIFIDRGVTMMTLKERMAKTLGMGMHQFMLCKSPATPTGFDIFATSASSGEPAEYKDMKSPISYLSINDGTCILIRKGKPAEAGELKASIILWDANKTSQKELFDIIVTDESVVADVLHLISDRAKGVLNMDLPVERMMLREYFSSAAGKPLNPALTLKDAVGYGGYDGRQYAVQVWDQPIAYSPDLCIPIVQRWYSSTWTMSPKMELPISGLLTMTQFAALVEAHFSIPAAHVMAYKPSFLISTLDESKLDDFKWETITHPQMADTLLAEGSWKLKYDMVVVRDSTEAIKAISEKERKALSKSANSVFGYDTSWSSGGSFSGGGKEAGLQIHTAKRAPKAEATADGTASASSSSSPSSSTA